MLVSFPKKQNADLVLARYSTEASVKDAAVGIEPIIGISRDHLEVEVEQVDGIGKRQQ